MSAIDKAVHTAYRLCRRYHMPPNEAAMCGAWLYQGDLVLAAADDANTIMDIDFDISDEHRANFRKEFCNMGVGFARRWRKAIKHGLMRRLEDR